MKGLILAVVFIFAFGAVALWADSPGDPAPTGYTLGDIYDYLNSGSEASPGPGGHDLEPPVGSVPGDQQFKSTDEIYDDTKAKFDLCDATAANVEQGKKFFSTAAPWGVQTGTLEVGGGGGGLLVTGQTSSQRAGDDGDHQKGTAFDLSSGGANTVIDNVTGLEWNNDTSYKPNWTTAIDWANGLILDGKSDWRLPNVRELGSLLRHTGSKPYMNTTFFPSAISDQYWTSTGLVTTTGGAYVWDNRGSEGPYHFQLYSWGTTNHATAVRGGD